MAYTLGEVNRHGYRLERMGVLDRERNPGCKWAVYDHVAPYGRPGSLVTARRRWIFATRRHAEAYMGPRR
jgi:hypothetical protein